MKKLAILCTLLAWAANPAWSQTSGGAGTGRATPGAASGAGGIGVPSQTGNSVGTPSRTGNSVGSPSPTGNSVGTPSSTGNSVGSPSGNAVGTPPSTINPPAGLNQSPASQSPGFSSPNGTQPELVRPSGANGTLNSSAPSAGFGTVGGSGADLTVQPTTESTPPTIDPGANARRNAIQGLGTGASGTAGTGIGGTGASGSGPTPSLNGGIIGGPGTQPPALSTVPPAGGNVVIDASGAPRPSITGTTAVPNAFDQGLTQRLRSSLGAGANQGGGLSQQNLNSLNIASDNGAVTLRGTVANAREKQLVESQLRRVVGVRSVNNQLEISETKGAPQTTAPIQNSIPQLAR